MAILAGTLVACGDRVRPDGSASPSPTPTPRADPTSATPAPLILRVRWMYLSDKKSLQLQEDGNPGLLKEARLLAPDGRVIVTGASHLAQSGEPRQCGGTLPPLVASLEVGPEVATALRGGTPAYTLEVRDNLTWYAVELLDWSRIAGGPCFE